jgi:5-methyltetrahydropteroyltriglutamate--homocysteine methyltransferase
MSVTVGTLGFPRIGPRRELKRVLERYWSGECDADATLAEAEGLRAAAWSRQRGLGVTHVPSNDFSLYDHVLDTSAMVGAIPAVYGWRGGPVPLETYFAMARGTTGENGDGLPALELTKWFDTNYHYMVPELAPGQEFTLASTKPLDEYLEAKSLGFETRPVLLGPVTYLLLAKASDGALDRLSPLPGLLPVYAGLLRRLEAAGAAWVQIDEPCLVLDLDQRALVALEAAYATLAESGPAPRLLLTTYFGGLGDNLESVLRLPVSGLHLDLVRAQSQLDDVLARAPADLVLSLGVVDGRNVWRTDLAAVLDRLEPVAERRGVDRLMLAPSCSLLHVPVDLELEDQLDPELRSWLAFAVQKITELGVIARALSEGRDAVVDALADSDAAVASRRSSPRIHDPLVAARLQAVTPDMTRRRSPFERRHVAQRAQTSLPMFPTTTIGSFPQTEEVRRARAAHLAGTTSEADYTAFLRRQIERAVRWQEEIGIDVLVHGEFERNDMVQYFGEQLAGFAFTKHGWVQSYGSRCVRPPILYGDVSRPRPITVEWSSYAQSLTARPMKGMLTGPVTMLQWSFVRDDMPRSQVCRQIALALRDEVLDLERAGIGVIQIDEPAIREGLPLRAGEWSAYLEWAVVCFRLTSSGVADNTQIHTHMCYSEFNDIIDAIGALDADVISIETARSKMELLEAFTTYRYPNEIGPGVYDIHAPRCPTVDEIRDLLKKATKRLYPNQIWVNPDCGLKTRTWDEVRPALINMVEAARQARSSAEEKPAPPSGR